MRIASMGPSTMAACAMHRGGPAFSRRRLRFALVAILALWVADVACPIDTTLTRIAAVALAFACWALVVALAWPRNRRRIVALFAPLPLALLLLPGGAADPAALRSACVRAMRRYEGTRYVWGGEGRLGIDCSGLVRRGLIDALVRDGIARAHPASARAAVALWWRDCSARSLGEGWRDLTIPVTAAPSIRALDESVLLPGDLAVTRDGVHVLAYAGDSEWIEADPTLMKVVTVRASDPGIGWLGIPVHVVRWRALAGSR